MLREQVITPRAGRSSNGGAGGGRNRAGEIAQRPVKRSGQRGLFAAAPVCRCGAARIGGH